MSILNYLNDNIEKNVIKPDQTKQTKEILFEEEQIFISKEMILNRENNNFSEKNNKINNVQKKLKFLEKIICGLNWFEIEFENCNIKKYVQHSTKENLLLFYELRANIFNGLIPIDIKEISFNQSNNKITYLETRATKKIA